MSTSKIYLATLLLSLHAANSYILLTANLDDVHSLAKQIVESPVVKELNEFIRRASSTINEKLPEVRKNNAAQIQTKSEPRLVENQAQIFRAHDSAENTERTLPLPIMGKKSAPANHKDNLDVWTPDKEAVAAELNAKSADSSSEAETNNIKYKPNHKMRRTDKDDDDEIVELGRNASFYLMSIKKIIESV